MIRLKDRKYGLDFVLLSFGIRQFEYNGLNVYYEQIESSSNGLEWHVEVDVPDMIMGDEQWYSLKEAHIRCSIETYSEIYNDNDNYLKTVQKIILAGLRKSGLIN